MATQQEDRKTYKRYAEKNKVLRKFDFVFDEDKITFKTQIPELPAKMKPKPNEEAHKKAVDQIEAKYQELKAERKKKKDQLKKGSQNFDQDISKNKKNVELGKKCLVVLNYDQESVSKSLVEVQQKIQKKTRLLRNLQRGPQVNKQQRKSYQEMTYEQIEAEQNRLSTRVSTANLNKKEQTEINAILAKLVRLKANAQHGEKQRDNTEAIQTTQDSIDRLKVVKQSLQRQSDQIKEKIQAIEQDIQQFEETIDDLEEQKKNPENEEIGDQCKDLKEQIYKLRDQIDRIKKQFEEKRIQYEYQQAKVQWIKWATEIQKKKNQEWEADRQQRRKQRLRQKEKQKNKQKGTDGAAVPQGQAGTEQKPERKRPNRYQKQIDNCAFLISYCEGLIKKDDQKQQNANKGQQPKNIEAALKGDEWSKLKGVQVIKSKKTQADEEQKLDKLKKKKVQKKQTQTVAQNAPTTFNHQFFTLHAFDSVRVAAPSKAQEVEGTLKQLNQKLTYYLEHPEGAYDKEREKEKNRYEQKGGDRYRPQKQAKGKYQQAEKKINTEEFPSLA